MANEKVISTQALIDKFELSLKEEWGYIYGMKHVVWSEARQKNYDKAYAGDSSRANSIKYGPKWYGHIVTDCSGLFAWWIEQLGGAIAHGSNSIFDRYCSAKGQLKNGKKSSGEELKPGTAVFVDKQGNKSHIGLYVGEGMVVEARGAAYGVQKRKISAGNWSYWGELKMIEYGDAPAPGPEPTPEPQPEPVKKQTIRKGNKNQYVKELQTDLTKLGYSLGICGIDGDFGTATEKAVREFQRDHGLEQDGICGPKTWAALDDAVAKLNTKPAEKKYSVTIRNLDLTQAKAIAGNYPGAEIKEESAND